MKYLYKKLDALIERKTANIDHNSVMGELATRADISGSYLLSIVLANLIALLGLLVNSIAVVIGAMLISPLMGPIFSLGLSFTLGDLRLGRRALYNIAASVTLTVALAAVLTFLSPLKEVTHEILVRTRPNIYDLFIAFFAGLAGAVAVCTRKNYLFTTTGVAVATAVIPPLSVVGYGVGTWQWSIASGGFLLFFTNLVAIVLSADLVFYFLRFRASMVESPRSVRRRLVVMGTVLALVSVPLVYTLVVDLKEARTVKRMEHVLKRALNRPDYSRVTSITHRVQGGKLRVLATVNTVKYYDSSVKEKVQQDLRQELGLPVSLELEQIMVKSGELPEPSGTDRRVQEQLAPPRTETLWQLRGKVMDVVQAGCGELAPFLAPYQVRECAVTFSGDNAMSILFTVTGDPRLTGQEKEWLRIALQQHLGLPVSLELKTVPLVLPVAFDNGGLTDGSRHSLSVLEKIWTKDSTTLVLMRTPRTPSDEDKKRENILREYLVKTLHIPDSAVRSERSGGDVFEVAVEPKGSR